MKAFLLTLSLAILTFSSSFAQSGWFPLHSGTSEYLNAPFFTDANTGYVVGWNGTILKTTNAGVNWSSSQSIATTELMRSVFFTDANTGYIATGTFGSNVSNVLKTTNAGANWNALTLPFYRHFYTIYFVNSNTGYVAGSGGTILKTTDAGSTWTGQMLSGLAAIISIYFVDANTGYAAEGNGSLTAGSIIKTIDGGTNWQVMYTYSGAALCGVSFIDANTGVAVGGGINTAYGGIIRTTDGGNNWTNLNYTSNQINLCSVRFISSSTGYITGAKYNPLNAIILKTTNAGINWYSQNTNQENFLSGSFFTSINTGYVTGYADGTILKTTDGGGNFVGINNISNEIPKQYSLSQNYPNPFNPKTIISYELGLPDGKAGITNHVSLKVFDVLGNEVTTLVSKKLSAGRYEVEFDGTNFPSGVYYYKLETGQFFETKKMVMLK